VSNTKLATLGLVTTLVGGVASGHTRIKPGASLITRSTSSAEKTAPCGSYPPATDPMLRTNLKPGAKLTVSWEETIQHTGHFRIAFSADGVNGFDSNILMDNIVDNQDGPTTYTDPTTYHQFSQVITVPSTLCENCALQVIQVMIDNHPMTPTNYYSCADIRISNTPAPIAGTGSGTTTNGSGTAASTTQAPPTKTAANSTGSTAAAVPNATKIPPAPPQNLKVTITP